MIPESIACVCCSAPIAVDPDDPNWSVRTETVDGIECVVERHLSLPCPQCGRSETMFMDWPAEPLRDDNGTELREPDLPGRDDETGEPLLDDRGEPVTVPGPVRMQPAHRLRFFNLVVVPVDPPEPVA